MKRVAFLSLCLASAVLITACSPWIKVKPDTQVYTFLDIPIEKLHSETEQYRGTVFEDRFKFFRIYRSREMADLAKREQVIKGKTHFTARPMNQYLHVIRIQLTARQLKAMEEMELKRQEIIKARIRFAGYGPDSSLAFDLLEIMEY